MTKYYWEQHSRLKRKEFKNKEDHHLEESLRMVSNGKFKSWENTRRGTSDASKVKWMPPECMIISQSCTTD